MTARTSSMRYSSVGIPPEAGAALVEADEPREGAQALVLPLVLEVGHKAGNEDEVERPGAGDR
jgi:hypothetical protein